MRHRYYLLILSLNVVVVNLFQVSTTTGDTRPTVSEAFWGLTPASHTS